MPDATTSAVYPFTALELPRIGFGSVTLPKLKKSQVQMIQNFFAGGLSASVSKTVIAPIERVKLLLQTQDVIPSIADGKVVRYTGISDCFRRVCREQGFAALWRGNWANVVRYFPAQAFNFMFKDLFRGLFPSYHIERQFWSFFATQVASGGLGGACSLMLVYPLDMARTRLASDIGHNGNREFAGLWDCLSKIYRRGGPMSLYDGFCASVIGIVMYRGAYFGMYDTAVAVYKPSTLLGKWGIAQTVTISAGLVAYPFDTVRRRMMTQAGASDRFYYNTLDCYRKIASREGIAAFYKGCLSNVIRGFGGAMVLVMYGELQRIFGESTLEISD